MTLYRPADQPLSGAPAAVAPVRDALPGAAIDGSGDTALLVALAADLDRSFEDLVLAHQDRLFTIALRMLGDPRDAEEAAQDALVRAYRALGTYEPARIRELRLRGWLATIVLNLCRSRAGRRTAHGAPPTSLDEASASIGQEVADRLERGPLPVVERRDERSDWARRLAALPVGQRAAVILRHVDGLSYPEMALALDRPEGTVKAQVHRGLALLRSMLEAERTTDPQELSA